MQAHVLAFDLDLRRWSAPLPVLDSPRTLVVVFGAPEVPETSEVLSELRAHYPLSKLIGSSTAGAILEGRVFDRSMTVAVVRFDRTILKIAHESADPTLPPEELGRRLGAQLARGDLRAVFVLAAGLQLNGSALARGLSGALSEEVTLTGGIAGDGVRFRAPWLCAGEVQLAEGAVAVGFYGNHIEVTSGVQGGGDAFGPQRQITRSLGNVLYELDHKPALALYKTYLAERALDLPASGLLVPLVIQPAEPDAEPQIRTLLGVDEATQSITFAGDVPQGAWAQLMRSNPEPLIAGARDAALQALHPGGADDGTPALLLAVSGIGRRMALGGRTDEELEVVRDLLPDSAALVGFYGYGELTPPTPGAPTLLHNQTLSLTLLRESAQPRARRPLTRPVLKPTAGPSSTFRGLARSVMTSSEPSTAIATWTSTAAIPATQGSHALPPLLRPTHITKVQSSVGPATLQVERIEAGGAMLVSFSGRMSESFRGSALGRELRGVVVLDLARVERITSYGVREWLQMLAEAEERVDALYLVRCSEAVSNQLSMIRAFVGSGQIVSFYAPYQCEHCSCLFSALIDCEQDHAELLRSQPPIASCPQCRHETRALDDDPASAFVFVPRTLQPVPAFLRTLLQSLPEADDAEPVEKTLDGDVTCIRINAALDPALRWSRILDGVEGDVRLDLGGVTQTTPNGVAALTQVLQRLTPQVRLTIQSCPEPVATGLAANPRETVRVQTLILHGRCNACSAEAPLYIDLEREGNAILQGRLPTTPCRRCDDGTVEVLHARTTLEALTLGAAPLPAEAIISTSSMLLRAVAAPEVAPPHAALTPEPAHAPAPPHAAPEPPPAPAPATPAPVFIAAPTPKAPAWAWGIVALLAFAILGLGAMLVQRELARQEGQPAPPSALLPGTPLPAATAANSSPTTRPPAASTPEAWPTPNGLPPAWTERAVTLEERRVSLVGHATGAASPDEGLSQARTDALARLIEALYRELRGQPTFALWRARLGDDFTADDDAVARLSDQLGAALRLERGDSVVRTTAAGLEIYVLYTLDRATFDAALDSYSRTMTFRGLTFARAFPAWRADLRKGDLVLVDALPELQALGARPGGILQSVDGEPAYDLDALEEHLKTHWTRLRWGQSIKLVVEVEGVPGIVLLERRGKR
jgi:ABC-type transporter Mla MlaB component